MGKPGKSSICIPNTFWAAKKNYGLVLVFLIPRPY